jgi:cytochrome c oxidase subunit 2
MRSTFVAVPQEQFSKWYNGEAVEIAGVSSPIGPPGGEELISQFGCSSCHSSDGSVLVGPSFKGMFGAPARVMEDGESRTIIVDEPYLRRHILDHDRDIVAGYPDVMPAFRGNITDRELEEIIDYLEQLQ